MWCECVKCQRCDDVPIPIQEDVHLCEDLNGIDKSSCICYGTGVRMEKMIKIHKSIYVCKMYQKRPIRSKKSQFSGRKSIFFDIISQKLILFIVIRLSISSNLILTRKIIFHSTLHISSSPLSHNCAQSCTKSRREIIADLKWGKAG